MTASHAAAAKAAAAQAQAAASQVLEVTSAPPAACHSEPGAEYAGEDVIVWGDQNPKVCLVCVCVCVAALQHALAGACLLRWRGRA